MVIEFEVYLHYKLIFISYLSRSFPRWVGTDAFGWIPKTVLRHLRKTTRTITAILGMCLPTYVLHACGSQAEQT